MGNIKDDLKRFDFVRVGQITVSSDGRVKFELGAFESSASKGWVYVWLVDDGDQSCWVAYVGKAGKTLQKRCDQHERGFNEVTSPGVGAKKTAPYIREVLENPRHRIFVYARLSPKIAVLGEDGVSMCEVEEMALIKKWNPCLNKTHNTKKSRNVPA